MIFAGLIDLTAANRSSTIEFDFSGVKAIISLIAENTIQKIGLETISSILFKRYILFSLTTVTNI